MDVRRLAALLILLMLLAWSVPPVLAAPSLATTQTTVYRISHSNSTTLVVTHTFHDTTATVWTFGDTIPAYGSRDFHVRDMPAIPSPWVGWVTLDSDQPFTAILVGYDGETPTPGGATPTLTATAPPTLTATPSRTPTVSPTSTRTVRPTRTPRPTRTRLPTRTATPTAYGWSTL